MEYLQTCPMYPDEVVSGTSNQEIEQCSCKYWKSTTVPLAVVTKNCGNVMFLHWLSLEYICIWV